MRASNAYRQAIVYGKLVTTVQCYGDSRALSRTETHVATELSENLKLGVLVYYNSFELAAVESRIQAVSLVRIGASHFFDHMLRDRAARAQAGYEINPINIQKVYQQRRVGNENRVTHSASA